MTKSGFEAKFSMVMVFLLPSLYFVGVQFAIGALVGEEM